MKKRSGTEGTTPVASLIDVVFLLIIFFVVTAAAEKDVVDESIQLAQAKYARAVDTKSPQQLTINVDADGDINIAKIPISKSKLSRILRAEWNAGRRNLPILIRADADTPYKYVDEIQNVIKENGFIRVKLAAKATQ